MDTQLCNKCKAVQPLENFGKDSRNVETGRKTKCKTCHNSYMRDWYVANPAAAVARYDYVKQYRQNVKDKVFNHYGHLCNCCGESNRIFLTLDHINNDGAEHRRQLGGGRSSSTDKVWRWVTTNNFPDDFQILCYNCNCGKRDNGGVCPHQVTLGELV